MSTKVRKLSMDEYQTKYKYNDSAYLRDINTEVSIESKYYKDFFTRLNRIRDFHMTEDTKPRTGANINKDYYSFLAILQIQIKNHIKKKLLGMIAPQEKMK